MGDTRSKGTKLKIDVVSVLTLIGQVEDINFDLDGDTIETTNHDSTTAWREFMGGLATGTLSGNYSWDNTETQQNAVETAMMDRTVTAFELEFPDAEKRQFSAIVTSLSSPLPVDGKMMRDFELQVTGKPTDNA